MNIITNFYNPLLKRKEINASIEAESNPGFEKTKKEIALHFKANDDVVVIKKVEGNFGRSSFLIDAFVYDSLEDKNKIEPKKKVKTKAGEAAK